MIGYKVRLASGGPVMTITNVDHENLEVTCEWINRSGFNTATFPIVCLDFVRNFDDSHSFKVIDGDKN